MHAAVTGTSCKRLGSDFRSFHNLFSLPNWNELGPEENLQSYVIILKVTCSIVVKAGYRSFCSSTDSIKSKWKVCCMSLHQWWLQFWSCQFSIELWKGLTENYQKDLAKIIVFSSKSVFLGLFSGKMFPNMLKLQVSNYDYQYFYPQIPFFIFGIWMLTDLFEL